MNKLTFFKIVYVVKENVAGKREKMQRRGKENVLVFKAKVIDTYSSKTCMFSLFLRLFQFYIYKIWVTLRKFAFTRTFYIEIVTLFVPSNSSTQRRFHTDIAQWISLDDPREQIYVPQATPYTFKNVFQPSHT